MLRIHDISAGYNSHLVLKEVSLEVRSGAAVALLGRNGSGKSTVLRTIGGLLRARSGFIYVGKENVTNATPASIIQYGVSYVAQGRVFFPALTIKENLEAATLCLRLSRSEINARIHEIFQDIPMLEGKCADCARSLSGGQQQMLTIGMALMQHPGILLLDEPSLGLAGVAIQEITALIRRLMARGVGLLLAEQKPQLVFDLCTYAYYLEQGRVAMEDEPGRLRSDEAFVTRYLGSGSWHDL